ncbi:7836_t:CDS:1, partial [Entrophospora sp. SA101]
MDINEELRYGVKIISELNACNKTLRDTQLKQNKKWDRERKQWDRERKQWESAFDNVNSDKQKLHTHASELIGETKRLKIENTNLTSENIRKDLSLAESKAENDIKSKKIRSLESMIKILEGKLKSAQMDVLSIQNDSLKKDSEILSLKSKIAELENIKSSLESKVNELEYLKSEAILKPIVGGDDGKNITKSDNISLGSTDLSKYFVRRKNMDQAGKIDTIIPNYTDDESTPIPKSPRVNTEITPKVSDETNISETNKPIMFQNQEIKNLTPYLAQPENYILSPIKPHPQISVGGIEAIRPSLEALPLSA